MMFKFVHVRAILLVACVLGGCSGNDAPKKKASKDRSEPKVVKSDIRAALVRLLERKIEVIPGEPGLPSFDHRPFVVFEDAESKKFVQFSGSNEEPLVFDLPSQTLNADERIRAEKMFAQMSVKRQPSVDDHYTYNVNYGKDVDRAADLTVRVFREIYKLPEGCKLEIRQE
jgi:hypothetical protein